MPQHDDDIYLGQAAPPGGRVLGAASATQMLRGIGPAGRVITYNLGAPPTAAATAVCAAQAISGTNVSAVINGTLSAINFVTSGQREVSFTTATHLSRGLNMVSSNAGDTTQTVTITGLDLYGQRMSQRKTLNGTTTVTFTKMFKTVQLVQVSATMAGTLSVGTYDAFGFPIRVDEGGYILKINWGNVYGPGDAGTVTTADTTSPATTTTNDTRGFYQPSSPANGSNRLVFMIMVHDSQVGPAATTANAFGVTQA